jgi:hypothetical protein
MDGKAKELGITDAGQASRFLVGQISRLGICGVVLDGKSGLHKVFAMILRDKGFVELQAVDGYTFWKSCTSCSKQS